MFKTTRSDGEFLTTEEIRLKTRNAIFNAIRETGKPKKYALILNEPHSIVKVLFVE